MTVAILMATHNGAAYLEEQVESILAQDCQGWHLIISDDASTDRTGKIISAYCSSYPAKISAIPCAQGGGAKENFWNLCRYAASTEYEYFMFCDQDDFWLPDKVRITLTAMQKAEKAKAGAPILVHTDLEVVDRNLLPLARSFVEYKSLDASARSLKRLLVQNNVTGCTVMFNRRLLDLALQVNNISDIAMHDWWFSLVASAFGEIVFVPRATMKYRQHGDNTLGARHVNSLGYILDRLVNNSAVKKIVRDSFVQAECFERIYYKDLDSAASDTVHTYCSLRRRNKLSRIWGVIAHGFYRQGFVQKLGGIMFI